MEPSQVALAVYTNKARVVYDPSDENVVAMTGYAAEALLPPGRHPDRYKRLVMVYSGREDGVQVQGCHLVVDTHAKPVSLVVLRVIHATCTVLAMFSPADSCHLGTKVNYLHGCLAAINIEKPSTLIAEATHATSNFSRYSRFEKICR